MVDTAMVELPRKRCYYMTCKKSRQHELADGREIHRLTWGTMKSDTTVLRTTRMKDGPLQRVRCYLRDHHVATLATSGEEGPWAAAVFYVNKGSTLYFLSAPKSRHCLNLAQNPQVALTVQKDYADWLEIKGVQIEGVATEISGGEEALARELYGKKFPVVGLLAQAPAAIVKALAKVRWYRIVPQRLYFIDNSLGLGNREEIELPLPENEV